MLEALAHPFEVNQAVTALFAHDSIRRDYQKRIVRFNDRAHIHDPDACEKLGEKFNRALTKVETLEELRYCLYLLWERLGVGASTLRTRKSEKHIQGWADDVVARFTKQLNEQLVTQLSMKGVDADLPLFRFRASDYRKARDKGLIALARMEEDAIAAAFSH